MTTDIARAGSEMTAITRADPEHAAAALAHILATGDLSKLSNEQRISHYLNLCQSLGLNSLSRPFDWLVLDNKLVLYPNKSCAEQLRREHQISVRVTRKEMVGEMFCVEVEGRTPNGRTDQASKYVPVTVWNQREGKQVRLTGQNLANAYAKAETGAKRRLVLSMVGLASPPDPDEVRGARFVTVDGTGRVLEAPSEEERYLAESPRAARAIGAPTFETVAAAAAPVPSTASQEVREEELLRPVRPNQGPTSFRADKVKWLRTWHAAVKGTYLEEEPARRAYLEAYTSSWPTAAQTYSLSRFLDIVTDAQAAELLQRVRHHLEERAAAIAADPDGELDGIDGLTPEQADAEDASQSAIPRGQIGRYQELFGDEDEGVNKTSTPPSEAVSDRVHNAAVLTGAPATPAGPERPDPSRQYTRAELLALYDAWGVEMKRLDTMWRPNDVRRFGEDRLLREVADLVAMVDNLTAFMAMTDDDPAEDAE